MMFSLILNGEILSLYSCKLSKPCSICLQEPIVELFDCCCRVRRSLHAVAFCVSQSFDPHSSHPNYIPFFSIFCLHSVQIVNNRRERETSDFFTKSASVWKIVSALSVSIFERSGCPRKTDVPLPLRNVERVSVRVLTWFSPHFTIK